MPAEQLPAIEWSAIGPVLALVAGVLLTMLVGSFARQVRLVLAILTLASIAAAGYATFVLAGERIVGLQGMVAIDGVSLFTTMILLFTAAVVTAISYQYLTERRIHRWEYYPLLLLATAGMVLLASANDLIMVFIAIEILSLPIYVLVGLARRDAGAQEGSVKYFLLSSFSSAILLYGVALAYGATGHTSISRIADAVTAGEANEALIFLAAGLLAVGFAFKISAVPFHMWTPDAYQGAPTSVTAFMAAGTKAAAFASLLRVFLVAFGALQWDWRPALWGIAIVTMVAASLIAIVQSDVKRMLAYSSVAHAGFALVGVVAASREGLAGTLFYLLVYAVMTLGAFAAVLVSGRNAEERLDFSSWTGIGQRHPVFAAAVTLFLLSLAGIPPTGGFMAKFFVFQAAVSAGEITLVLAGVLASVIAAFFYLRLIVLMWLQEPDGEVAPIGVAPAVAISLGVMAAATLLLGVWPQELMELARRAAVFTG